MCLFRIHLDFNKEKFSKTKILEDLDLYMNIVSSTPECTMNLKFNFWFNENIYYKNGLKVILITIGFLLLDIYVIYKILFSIRNFVHFIKG